MNNVSVKATLLALAVGFCAAAQVQATEPSSPTKTVNKKAKNSSTSGSPRVSFHQGSEETNRQRSDRLKRECKGQTNAGACTGYTR
jgi:hypothetical protein